MHKWNGNAVLLTGTIILSFGFFTVATEAQGMFILGISLLGFAAPFTILPLFPMMTNSIAKDEENSEQIKNTLSGLYNAALGIGAILGPLIGSHLYYYFGFDTTAYCLWNACIVLSIILFISGGWCRSSDSLEDYHEHFDIDLPDYSNMSFVKVDAIQVPQKLSRDEQYDIEDFLKRSENERTERIFDGYDNNLETFLPNTK